MSDRKDISLDKSFSIKGSQTMTINKKDIIKSYRVKLDNVYCKNDKQEGGKVSIITCTNRTDYLNNIFENYVRQNYMDKELIVILNSNELDLKKWQKKAEKFNIVKVLQVDEKKSKGECINIAVRKINSDYVAIFDDDDFYSKDYLKDSMTVIKDENIKILGKSTIYIYFKDTKTLAVLKKYRENNILKDRKENNYVPFVMGGTLIIKKEVFSRVLFSSLNCHEDVRFCKDCIKSGYKIYSSDRFNFVYIRHSFPNKHSWNINNEELLKRCVIVAKTDDYTRV